MKVFVVVVYDKHSGTDVRVFLGPEDAIADAQEFMVESVKHYRAEFKSFPRDEKELLAAGIEDGCTVSVREEEVRS